MDKHSPGDGDDVQDDAEECEVHPGVECEYNTGADACPCRKDCCLNEEDTEEDYDSSGD